MENKEFLNVNDVAAYMDIPDGGSRLLESLK